jgi:hypothetical protein
MSKHHRHNKSAGQHKDGGTFDTLPPQIEALLSAQKTHDAVEAAKQLVKHAPSPAAEALLVKAYQARIHALLSSGLAKEAQALGLLVAERFPAYREAISDLVRQSEMSAGNFQTLLTELLTADTEKRRELETILARGLTDPAVLANSSILPADHPLKRTAAIVSHLFAAVTSGPLPEGALLPLNDIPRHSPLAPWKLLIRAFDAFYQRNDAAVLANLAGIPPEVGPARLVPVLRHLVGEKSDDHAPSFAVTAVLNKVQGNRTVVRTQLAQLSHALTARNERQALAAVQALIPVFQSTPIAQWRTFLATLIHHWQRQGFPPEGLLRALPKSKTDPDIVRLIALSMEPVAWEVALDWWGSYLTIAKTTGIVPQQGPDLVRILLHMAALFPQDPLEVLETLDAKSEADLRAQIRSGELAAHHDRGALLEQAHAADPSLLTFRALVSHFDQWSDSKRAETEAEAWHKAYPQELEPVLYLIRAAERHGASRKALDLLAEAEALNRLHPDVRQSRFRLLLASAERRLREGKATLALEDLDQLAQQPRAAQGEIKAYLLALSWAAALKAGNTEGAERLEQLFHATVSNPVLSDLLIGALSTSLKIKLPRRTVSALPEEAIAGLARACTLFQSLDRSLPTPVPAVLSQIEKNIAQATPEQLHALCRGGSMIGRPSLTYAAAGQGLRHDGPLQYRFLLARGQTLSQSRGPVEQSRARQCLRAARELASRARDMEAVREASQALETVPHWDPFLNVLLGGLDLAPEEAPTAADIAKVIAIEGRNVKIPRFPAAKSPRPVRTKKPKRPRLPGGMLDDLFSFLDNFGGKW